MRSRPASPSSIRRAVSFLLILVAGTFAPGLAGRARGEGAAATRPPQRAIDDARAGTLPPYELERRLLRGGSVLLRAAIFDPVAEPMPEFARGRKATGGEGAFLIQFRDDLTSSVRQELEGAGVAFVDYVPSRTYLVRASPAAFAVLQNHPRVRWLDAFRGGYKVAPVLRSDAWTQDVYLNLRLLPGVSPMDLLDRLRRNETTVRLSAVQGEIADGATLRVLVPAGHLHPFVERAAEDGAVWTIEPWFLPRIDNDNSVWTIQSYDTTNRTNYALSATLWNHGITGTGQLVAIADSGLDDDMCYFRNSGSSAEIAQAQTPALPGTGTIDLTKKVAAYYVLPQATAYDGNALCNGRPESYHGTHVTGSVLGDNYVTLSSPTSGGHDTGDGMAPNAQVIFQDAASEVTGCLSGLGNDFHLIWQQAYDAGARVHSNSWGADAQGEYTGDSRLIDEIMYDREDMLVLFANGNGTYFGTVLSPATAKNCLAVGATSNGAVGANTIAAFSSKGPTADGRIKPDVVAPGESIVSAAGDASHASDNCGAKLLSGTSMATPTVAGGATLLRQYFTDGFYPSGAKTAADTLNPSAALLKAAVVNGAVDVAYTTQATMLNGLNPWYDQGFGRIQLDNVAFFSTPSRDARRTRLWDKWKAAGLVTGEADEYALQVAAGQPLKVALAWTDPEASGLAATTLVNNLDLEVVSPSGSTYRGNVFAGGQSVVGGSGDLRNTVEVVFLTAPIAGTWNLRVRGTSIPGTPAQSTSTRQGYAMVATYADCAVSLAAPSGPVATDNGSTGVDLAWSAVEGATGYQIYRTSGTCAAPPTTFHLVGQTASTSFTDTLVQGGFGYAYRVRAVTACGEGAIGPCVSATYSGNCTLFPTFAGLTSAIDDHGTAACDSLLGWSAGSSNCPLAAMVSHDVYRSTDPYALPGPATILAAGAGGTTYRDATVTPNTTYYYTVRAEDGTTANGGPANGGNVDPNLVTRSVTPTSSANYAGTWTDDGGDGVARLILDPPWRVSHQQNHTAGGSLAYHSGPDGRTYPADTCVAATTPAIPLQPGRSPVLTYWARYDLEYQWDGVVVEISTNGGTSWTALAPTPPYPATLAMTGDPPFNMCGYPSTQAAFTGPDPNGDLSPWAQYSHDLTPYSGQTVMIRWRLSTDPGTEFEGFYLDDVTLTEAMVPASCGADPRLVASAVVSDVCAGGGAGSGNGILDAGEDVAVAVSLQNIGDTADTGITGTLSTSYPGAVVTRPAAAFADVASGATVGSASPHFSVWVSPAVTCGTSIPFTLAIASGQGTWTRSFSLTVGAGSTACAQTPCASALPVEDGTGTNPLRIAAGAGTSVNLTFGLSCHAVDSTVYWGRTAGAMSGIAWTNAACGFGAVGAATVDPGSPPLGGVLYFVVVPSNGLKEGSYGRDSNGVERLPASGLGACTLPQELGATCP